ncbi:MAG: ATP phosphoribosyltransferase regulatory subunit [Polyangiaceae bacterium]|nr:ATP phosphoribosyltransferase regulatory subunit [Polyangiaceae bacterium]
MRDLLPDEARRRRALARRVLDHFGLHGFDLVTLPAFELAEVLERGLGNLDAADVLRFIEPESGEVAALRPDMTPQIARLIATRLASAPPPIRLCYEGTVIRRRPGRARRHRQVPQAGVELFGLASIAGDLEILRLAASVSRAAGLTEFVVDLGHATIARALLDAVPPELAGALSEALELKDSSRLCALLTGPDSSRVPRAVAEAIVALPDLHGGGAADPDGHEVFARAARLMAATAAAGPLEELRALWDAARATPELTGVLRVDVGEIRGLAYYTGAIFHVLAEGPGEPIASGGRYDDLLGRFGVPMPAVGFALHLDAVARAREVAGIEEGAAPRAVVAVAGARGEEIAGALRGAGIPAVLRAPEDDPAGYADAWDFSHIVMEREAGIVVSRRSPSGAREEAALERGSAGPAIAEAIRGFGAEGASRGARPGAPDV